MPSNAKLYNVYAMSAPKELGGHETLIGTLVLDGKLTKSQWGDENLFIRHQNIEDDQELHPEWKPYYSKFTISSVCPFLNF